MNRVESLLRAATRDEAAEVSQYSVPSFERAGLPVPRPPLLRFGPLASPLLAADRRRARRRGP